MGFSDFKLQFGNGKQEKLNNVSHGVRRDQIDEKFQNLFDMFDENQDGTLEAKEVEQLAEQLKAAAGSDRILDHVENARIKSIFDKQHGIKDLDFQGFLKAVSDASEEITSFEERSFENGEKEIVTKYSNGIVETIAYYANGDYKWKRVEESKSQTYYEMYVGNKKTVLSEEEFNKELKKMEKQKPGPMIMLRQRNAELPLSQPAKPSPVQQTVRLYSQTNSWLEPKDFQYSPKAVVERMGVDINSEEGKKIAERVARLEPEVFKALGDGKEMKDILTTYELEANFDNIANIMEMLYGTSIRTKEEFEASAPQRERIALQIKSIEVLVGLYETLAQWNDEYTDSIGLFGMGSEAIGYLLNKVGLDGENHYQFAESCREIAQNCANLNPLNPKKFEEGFKKIRQGKYEECNLDYNENAFRHLLSLLESGRATKNGSMTQEYKDAVLKAVNLTMDNPNESLYNQIMNGFGEALLMYMTMGIAAEAKGAQVATTATVTAFSRAGVGFAAKGLNSRLLQGAMRYSGNFVKLMGPALNEGTKMAVYTLAEGTFANVGNRAIKFNSEENSFEKFLATEQMVIDNSQSSFGFGAFAGVFGTVVTSKVMQSASRVSEKVGTSLAEKFAQGPVNANEIFATFLEKSAPTKVGELAAFATDVLGFTAFESVTTALSHMDGFPDDVTPENVVNFLWAEFKNQGYSLGQLKVISHLVMMLTGSRSARMQSQKYIREQIPQLDGVKVTQVGEGYIMNLPSGKRVECKNMTEMLSACQLMVTGETALSKTFSKPQKHASKTLGSFTMEDINSFKALQDLSVTERADIFEGLNKGDTESLLLTLHDGKSATYISYAKENGTGSAKDAVLKLKSENIDVVDRGEDAFVINKNMTKATIEQNKELFIKRLGLDKNASTEEIYNAIIAPESPYNGNNLNDITGIILGYPKYDALIFELEGHIENGAHKRDGDLEAYKQELLDALYSEDSPYKDMSADFKQELSNKIKAIKEIQKSSNVIGFVHGYQFVSFVEEPSETLRIQNALNDAVTEMQRQSAQAKQKTKAPASNVKGTVTTTETTANTPVTETKVENKAQPKAKKVSIPEGFVDCKGELSPTFQNVLENLEYMNSKVFDASSLDYIKSRFTTEELKQVEEIYNKVSSYSENGPISQNEIPRLMRTILMGKYFQETKDFDFAHQILDFTATERLNVLFGSIAPSEFFNKINHISQLSDVQAIKGLINLSKTCENPLIKNIGDISHIVSDMTLEGMTPIEIVDAMRRTDKKGNFLLGSREDYENARTTNGFLEVKQAQQKNHKFRKDIKLPEIKRIESFDLDAYKENNPQLRAQIEAIEGKASPDEIEILARVAETNPEFKDDIFNIISKNKNIRFGLDSSGQLSRDIYNFVTILKENTNLHDEIIEFMSVNRVDDNFCKSTIPLLEKYIQILNEEPNNATAIRRFAQNPNLEPEEISDLILFGQNRLKNDPQAIEDMYFFSSKNFDGTAIRKNVVLLKRTPELRNTLTSETPKYSLIDKEPANTPVEVIQKRFAVRDNVEKVTPEGLKELETTLGKDFFNKVRWEDIIPGNATPTQIRQIVSELNAKCKFFARIERNEKAYGKNIQWATEIYNIEQVAVYNMKYGDEFTSDFTSVMEMIAERYHDLDISTTLEGNRDRRVNSGISRLSRDGWPTAQTGYTENDYGAYGYSQRFFNNKRQSPYPDVLLTKTIDNGYYEDGNYTGKGRMEHPDRSTIGPSMSHADARFEEIRPLIEKVKNGGILSEQEKEHADKNIAEIYYLLANAMPWNRGSNGICDIFMRSAYESLGIDKPALKRNISLDLEAFCMTLDEYKQKWNTFFEE